MTTSRISNAACFIGLLFASTWLIRTHAKPPPPDTLWQVSPPLDYNDKLFAGWKQISVEAEIQIYNGVAENRTYAHHPELFAIGSNVLLIYSSAPVDEDSMGQDIWISTSSDNGSTWSSGRSLMPAALLPNQTETHNWKYWCDRGIAQRAWQALTFVHLEGELYAVGQSGSRWCPETVYGTEYGMEYCARACEINAVLRKPDEAPAWSPWLYNNGLYAADGLHQMEEQTFAVWHNDSDSSTGGYWQRHWRDITSEANNTHSVWVEYSADPKGNGWYPKIMNSHDNAIHQTNIPDAKTKQFLGKLENTGDRFLLSNPRYNAADPQRQPLTLALSRGADQTYKSIGVLRTNATKEIVPDTRDGIKNRAFGFSYPSAVQVGRKLLIAYSENKENIWVSVVDISALP
ncbi:hypothetical protein CNYM01_11898 [Colletotrichum nymphaeae SA-01]|uniref:Sialidase domain-containing protein n=1 Tax=Colletotrichum nymphaeae SA-01 TaxID=1460502 RepID=A0A135TY50_9PEZI|nr:hypothetical protein CNYM01_11898 [Colletotrichum nymphaeae SA-01]